MRIVQVATALVATIALVSCEPVTEPATDDSFDPPAPSFAVLNPVIEQVNGGAGFHWVHPSTGEEFWLTSSLNARRYADGSVTGTYQRNIHGRGNVKARITCFTIIGSEAWLGMIIEDASYPALIGSERVLYVMDNGQGSKAEPDRSTSSPRLTSTGFGTLEEYCQAASGIDPSWVYELESGNIQVRENSQAVVEKVTGSAMFHRTVPRTGVTYWHRQTFTAWRIADGSALGRLHGIGSQGPFGGGVHCFTVRGNEAWIGFYAGDQERVVYVMDNGEGAHAPPDRSTGFPPLGITGLPDLDTYCAETPEIRARSVFDLEAGNIQILP